MQWVKDNGEENTIRGLEHFSHRQLFFLSYAKV